MLEKEKRIIAIEMVINKLRLGRGKNRYLVKNVSKIMPYDILADDKFKVDVVVVEDVGFEFTKNPHVDATSVVIFDSYNEVKIYFTKNYTNYLQMPSEVLYGKVKKNAIKKELRLKGFQWYSPREVAVILYKKEGEVFKLIEEKKIKCTIYGEGRGKRYRVKGLWVQEFISKFV